MSRRGQGSVFRPKYKGADGSVRESSIWWISYSVGGKKIRESSKTSVHREAVRLLHQRLAERGRVTSRRDLEKVTFSDLAGLIVSDYKKNRRRSITRLHNSLEHLRRRFGDWRTVDIREDAIDRYASDRLDEGAAPATINRELAALRRMFRLADRAGIARDIPRFDLLAEDNVRRGFFEEGQFAALRAALPEHLRPLAEVAYITGWRKGELLSRQWKHVDFEAGWLRMEPGETKNRRGRMFPLIPQLRAILEAQRARKEAVERQSGAIVSALFFREDGRPIQDYRRAWRTACEAAGLWAWVRDEHGDPVLDARGGQKKRHTRLFHDFRRTAARNLVRAGIPTALAKEFTGHKTDSVFQRYAIADETSLREAGVKYAEQLGTLQPKGGREITRLG